MTVSAQAQQDIDALLQLWFGDLSQADLPDQNRTTLWFSEDAAKVMGIHHQFDEIYNKALHGELSDWENYPRGRLALIILLDQFPRILGLDGKMALDYFTQAYALSLGGIRVGHDHQLALIERVFFYLPLVHTETIEAQEMAVRLFQQLTQLSMPETTQVYQLFLAYAYAHHRVIKQFGRFPQRNRILGRENTEEESSFLKQI